MPQFKVKLDDGTVKGPIDAETVQKWYVEGLLGPESPAKRAGTSGWTRVESLFKIESWGTNKLARRRLQEQAVAELEELEKPPQRWRAYLAGLLLCAAGVGAGYGWQTPGRWRPELDGAPWLELAIGCIVFGLGMLFGRDGGRKVVRILVLLASLALLPLVGILVAQSAAWQVPVALVALWVMVLSLVLLSAEARQRWVVTAVSLLAALGTAAGAAKLAYVPETEVERTVREWALLEKQFADEELAVTVPLPEGWVQLPVDNPVVRAPKETLVILANPRLHAFALLRADRPTPARMSLESYLQSVLVARQEEVPSLELQEPVEAEVGALAARRVLGTWSRDGEHFREQTTVWKDGWVYFALTAWGFDAGERTQRELDTVTAAPVVRGTLTARLRESAEQLSGQVPPLTAPAAELLLLDAGGPGLTAEAAFRASVAAAARGLPQLRPSETEDYARITQSMYASVRRRRQRRWLTGYLDRLAAGDPGSSGDDSSAAGMIRSLVERLPPATRTRLELLYEDAIRAGLEAAPAGEAAS